MINTMAKIIAMTKNHIDTPPKDMDIILNTPLKIYDIIIQQLKKSNLYFGEIIDLFP